MTFGFDISPRASICCASKVWEHHQVGAGLILDAFGTIPDRNSICPDAQEKTLIQVKNTLFEMLDQLATSRGNQDIQFAQMSLVDVLSNINQYIREVRSFLGQGIYMRGVVLYITEQSYAVISFGGNTVLRLDSNVLVPMFPVPQNCLIRNALGGNSVWKPEIYVGDLHEGLQGILASTESSAGEGLLTTMEQHMCNKRGTQLVTTTAALIRRELEDYSGNSCAVLLFQR